MAEAAKRPNNSAGTPAVATPNASTLSVEQALTTSVGARIRIQTTNPYTPTLEGTLFTACPKTCLLAVTTGTLPSSTTHHIIPLSSLAAFSIISLPPSPQQPTSLGPVNTTALLARANTALARAKEKATKLNQAVGRETQDVFDALDKQFGAQWKGKDILVMERVVVKGPGYKGEDCRVVTKDGEGLLGRVKKVLENERKRALQRDGGKAVKPAVPTIVPAVPAPQGPRKGG